MPRKRKTRAVARRKPTRRRRRVRRVARRVGRATRRVARRGVSLAGKVASDNKHTLFAAGTGALLGALEDRVKLWSIPGAKQISPAGVLAVGFFGLSFFVKQGTLGQIVRHMTTGCASIATYVLSKKYLGPAGGQVLGQLDDFMNDTLEEPI